jgi:hypothetical protein
MPVIFDLVIVFNVYVEDDIRSIYSKNVKVNFHPRTGHESPERKQRYSFTVSLTSALDRGGWSTPRPGRFTPGKETRCLQHTKKNHKIFPITNLAVYGCVKQKL